MIDLIINAMAAPMFSAQQIGLVLPVAAVVIFAVLIFVFGFQKSVEPPSFKQLNYSTDDKKTKKKKIKEKKTQSNGHAVVIDVSDSKKVEAPKAAKVLKVETPKQKKNAEIEKEKKVETQKSPSKKDKKVNKDKNAQKNEKPIDFDDGEWETAPSRKDKKKKKDDQDVLPSYTPEKPGKKSPEAKKELAKKADAAFEFKPMEILKIEDILPPKKEEAIEAAKPAPAPVVVEPPVSPPAGAPEVAPEESAAKKKKTKKPKTSVGDGDVAAPAAPAAASVQEAAVPAPAESQPQVFNELEDAWKEAPQKKSKKKARKD